MAREYPRTGGGSSPACHRRSDVSRAAELTPWSSARDRSVDDLDLVLLHPFDPRSGDLDKLEVESRLLAGLERRLRGRCGGRAQKLALGVKSLSGERSEEHTSELQSPCNLVCRLLLEKKKKKQKLIPIQLLTSTESI